MDTEAGAQQTRLCERCAVIDFNNTELTRWDNKLRSAAEWKPDICQLCALLMKYSKTDSGSIAWTNYKNSASWSTSKEVDKPLYLSEVITCQFEKERSGWASGPRIAIQREADSPLRVITPWVDFKHIKEWIKYCERSHTGTSCNASEDQNNICSAIPSLRFIDCETKSVVPAANTDGSYAALSYVWGGVDSDDINDRPATIEDAMTVASSLGLRYLWVDRYCIIQSSKEDKAAQVGKMDLIYSSAYITIIAAAGSDPSHGLPGVSRRPRSPRPHAQIGNFHCVVVHDDPFESMRHSKWMTRGWTYQEGLLSSRRLIFTGAQVYYECAGMYYWETLNIPFEKLHVADGSTCHGWLCNGANVGIFPQRLGNPRETPAAGDVTGRIAEYSERNLGKPEDILNAFRGVLHAFEKYQVFHCHGVPILHQASPFNRNEYLPPHFTSPLAGFCEGFLWLPLNSSSSFNNPPLRRPGFPSWSWTGWIAPIAWDYLWDQHTGKGMDHLTSHMQISVEHQDGRITPFAQFYNDYGTIRGSGMTDVLHVQAWTYSIDTSRIMAVYRDDRMQCDLDIEVSGGRLRLECFLARTPTPEPRECFALILLDNLSKGETYWLVVQEVEAGVYERLGLAMSKTAAAPLPPVLWKEFRLG